MSLFGKVTSPPPPLQVGSHILWQSGTEETYMKSINPDTVFKPQSEEWIIAHSGDILDHSWSLQRASSGPDPRASMGRRQEAVSRVPDLILIFTFNSSKKLLSSPNCDKGWCSLSEAKVDLKGLWMSLPNHPFYSLSPRQLSWNCCGLTHWGWVIIKCCSCFTSALSQRTCTSWGTWKASVPKWNITNITGSPKCVPVDGHKDATSHCPIHLETLTSPCLNLVWIYTLWCPIIWIHHELRLVIIL